MADHPHPVSPRGEDDVDTRAVSPVARARRNRTYGRLVALALCAVCGLVGYTIGRGPKRGRATTVVQSELDEQAAEPASAIAPEPAPGPPRPPATLGDVSARDENTKLTVCFNARVVKALAEEPGYYVIEPGVKVVAAELAGDGRTVVLTTSPLEHDVHYRLTVKEIEQRPVTTDDLRASFRYLGSRRVLQGLVALYTFEEGQGEIVHDVSRVGEPMDLKITKADAVARTAGGLAIEKDALAASEGDGAKIIEACRAANALTIEVWLKPANATQAGPARIITLSRGGGTRNFTLGQEGPRYYIRLRTSKRDENGEPAVASKGGVADKLTHLVYTRDADGKVAIWLDGQLNTTASVPGDFSTWAPFPFGLANEIDATRTWLGELHLVALYARALTPDEVNQNWKAGPEGKTPRPEGAE